MGAEFDSYHIQSFTVTLIKKFNTRNLKKYTSISTQWSLLIYRVFEDLLVPQNAPPGLGQPLRAPDGSFPGLLPDMCSEVVILLAWTATRLPPTPVTQGQKTILFKVTKHSRLQNIQVHDTFQMLFFTCKIMF